MCFSVSKQSQMNMTVASIVHIVFIFLNLMPLPSKFFRVHFLQRRTFHLHAHNFTIKIRKFALTHYTSH